MKSLTEFTDELVKVFGDNLVSAVVYGSSVVGDLTKKYSDVDVFLLLKDTRLSAVRPALPLLRQWIKLGNKTPLLYSVDHFDRSLDVFAIEFSDIKDQHRVLYGSDPFKSISIEKRALRTQVEFELRANLLRLRRHYLESGSKTKEWSAILAQSLSTFSALFRAVLRLLDEPAPGVKKDAWLAINKHVAIDMAALEKIWDLRGNMSHLDPKTLDGLFDSLTQTVEAVINFVDRLS